MVVALLHIVTCGLSASTRGQGTCVQASNNTRAVVFLGSRVANVSVFYLITGIDGVCYGLFHDA